jgi:hypothetical protein
MIVDVPFSYTALYVPPKARNEREVTVLDTLPLSVREIDEGDFPVVARFADNTQLVRYDQIDDIRWDSKGFYRPWATEWARERFYPKASDLAELVKGHEGDQPFRDLQKVPEANWHNRPIFTHRQVQDGGRVLSDDRRERVAALVARAAATVLSAGRMWVACGEPAWRVEANGFITASPILADAKARRDFARHLARADDLGGYARRFWRRDTLDTHGLLEVVRPEALTLAPEAAHLAAAAADAAERMSGRLKRAAREDFGVYADLRDAVEAAPENEITEELADAVRAAIDHESAMLGESERRDLSGAFEWWRVALIRGLDGGSAPAPR